MKPEDLQNLNLHKLIDKLSESQLIELNSRIIERLKFLNQTQAHSKMLEFRIGQRVTFRPDGRPPVIGIISRYNKKTVTVISDDHVKWTVSPGFLKAAPLESRVATESQTGQVIQLR